MPKPYPREFRNVVAVGRKGEASVKQITADFGISESYLNNWLRAADVEDGNPAPATAGLMIRMCRTRAARLTVRARFRALRIRRHGVDWPIQVGRPDWSVGGSDDPQQCGPPGDLPGLIRTGPGRAKRPRSRSWAS